MLRDSTETQPTNICSSSEPADKDSSSSEEEIEPILKYERLRKDVQTVLQKEAVSCVTFNSTVICIGTFWGLVHVFDHQGNRIRIEHTKTHTVAVNQINLDETGHFIATCADDGKAFVYGLYSADSQLQFITEQPVSSVAIDPHYCRSSANKRFVTGGDRLLMHEKSYFVSRVRTTALQESVGNVQTLKWRGRFVSYACGDNVRIYDVEDRKMVGLIVWDQPEGDRTLEQYSCCLTWKNSTTLLIGWCQTFRICRIQRRHPVIKESPSFMINVVITMKVNYFICGICPLDLSQLVILAYKNKRDASGGALAPRLHFLEFEDNKYVEVYSDTLLLRFYRHYTCDVYHLEYCYSHNKFVIACPKDVVVAVPYDHDERIDLLVERNQFEKALALATAKPECLQRYTRLEVGQKYINYLLTREEFTRAGQICAQVLGDNKELWEKEAFKFARAGQLRAISQYLPTDPQHQLDTVFEIALYKCAEQEPQKFADVIQKKSRQLKDNVEETSQELAAFRADAEQISRRTLNALFTHFKPYDEVLDFYIAVKYKGVFEYIEENKLKKKLYGKLNGLLEVDPQQAVNFLVDGERLNVDMVVSELQKNRYYQYLYLDALNINFKFEARKYHNLLVKLYAEFSQAKLLPLLRRSRYYSFSKALSVCEQHNLYREVVHLLSRMGGSKKALQILLHEVDDMEMAVLLCERQNDFELWQDLIEHYKAKPEFIEYLLPRMDKYLDPRKLIRQIDDKARIGDVKKALVHKLQECRLKISMEESCKNILATDYNYMFEGFVSMQKYGRRVDYDFICGVCNQKVMVESSYDNIIMFLCSHTFHEKCLSSTGNLKNCFSCSASHSKTVHGTTNFPKLK